MARCRRIAFFLSASVFLLVSSAAAEPIEPVVTILSSEPLDVSSSKGENSVDAKLSVMNTSSRIVRPSVTFQASSDERVNVRLVSPKQLKPGQTRILTVKLGPVEDLREPVTGQIVIDDGTALTAQSVNIDPPAPDEPWPLIVILGSLVIAALAMWRVLEVASEAHLKNPAPDPKWSFSSWATTLTAIGGAFGVILGAATYPEFPGHVSKSELVNLNILFALLLLAGPFLYEALRKFTAGGNEKGEWKNPKREGTRRLLVFASAFTLWAVVGQVGALGLLGAELVSGIGDYVCVLAAIVFVVLAVKYFLATTREQVEMDWEKKAAEEKAAAAKEDEEGVDGAGTPRPLSWSLP